MKWIASLLVYLAVVAGLFIFHSAWTALLLFHFAIITSLFIAKSKPSIKILFTGNDLKWILVSVFLCGSTGIALYFFWNKFGIASDISANVEALGLNRSDWIPFLAYFALVNPFLEEYFWRGYLGSKTTSFVASDFLYAGFHGLVLINKVQTNMIVYALATLIVAGWLWRQLARVDGGLLAPVLGHMAADFSILTAVYLNLYN